LAALVRESLAADPFSGAVYVFCAKREDRIKLVFWNDTGLCLFAKRLEDEIFRWPKIEDGVIHLSAAQLSAQLEGLDWRRVHPRPQRRRSSDRSATEKPPTNRRIVAMAAHKTWADQPRKASSPRPSATPCRAGRASPHSSTMAA
jgi:hypothetical protein